jgi:hypothetical protein
MSYSASVVKVTTKLLAELEEKKYFITVKNTLALYNAGFLFVNSEVVVLGPGRRPNTTKQAVLTKYGTKVSTRRD